MIYLIVQMIAALVLAAICGGAIGWLIHRTTHARDVDSLRRSIGQQRKHLAQSQSEIGMLSEDYEELQRRSQDEIDGLREETGQIPALNTNLEKSQLLVRQMMQKHESKLRDLNGENQSLNAKLKNLENREQDSNIVRAELDRVLDESQTEPDQNTESSNDVDATTADSNIVASALAATGVAGIALAGNRTSAMLHDSDLDSDPHVDAVSDGATASDVDTRSSLGNDSDTETASSVGTTPNVDNDTETASSVGATSNVDKDTETASSVGTASSVNTVSDTDTASSIETGADLNTRMGAESTEATPSVQTASEAATGSAPISNARSSGSWASASVASSSVNHFSDSAGDSLLGAAVSPPGVTTDSLAANEPEADLLNNDPAFDSDPFDNVMEVGDELQRELDIDADLMLDGSNDASCLFDPVEHRDDLKQIFGIGPVTEKALNELGITSYSQLADLKDHDIEKIAGALEIVPGRIERDDWVGNARRQLEDVLEQL